MVTRTRVAFFPDAFHETNGVARTSRAIVAAAEKRGLPLLCVHAGPVTKWLGDGTIPRVELARGPISFALEHDLRHDLLLWRYARRVLNTVRAFRADVVHITGPSDIGQLGAYVAHRLNLPLVGSWHTNLHEFVAWRARKRLGFLPGTSCQRVSNWIRRCALQATLQFYGLPSVLMAPNLELVEFLQQQTGKPTYLMRRGVDTAMFSPAKRDPGDSVFRFGYVGRLSSEKNVRLLLSIERDLVAAGHAGFRFVVVGEGSERSWLAQRMVHAEFTGVLHGESLARAYASMDLLIFPSETDTFGNVVQEALASGTPAVVSGRGGPKFIVRHGVSGFVAPDERGFMDVARRVLAEPERYLCMRVAARQQALASSWDCVFDEVIETYATAVHRRRDMAAS